ncbi:MAG: MFS transporter, partial [Mycobacterium sp.]
LYLPMESVLFPKYFTDRNEPAQLGWVLMALSIGGLVGALSWTWLSRISSKRAMLLTAVPTFGVAAVIIAALPPLPLILVLAAITGLVYGPIGPIYNSVLQTRTPEQLRGRVLGVMTSMTYAAGPLGFMLAGPLVDAFGLKVTFLVLALPILLIALVCPWITALRELDRVPS